VLVTNQHQNNNAYKIIKFNNMAAVKLPSSTGFSNFLKHWKNKLQHMTKYS